MFHNKQRINDKKIKWIWVKSTTVSAGKVFVKNLCESKCLMDVISGFQSNIVTALEDLKNDESFVDVTLSCDGETIQVEVVMMAHITY